MIKSLNKLRIEGYFLNLIKSIHKNLQLTSQLIVNDWMLPPKIRDKTKMFIPEMCLRDTLEILSKATGQEKEI